MTHQPTKTALILKEALEAHGLHVVAEPRDGRKRVDLMITDAKLIIEVDGIQHLTNPYQIQRDLTREHYSDVVGNGTIHIPNNFIYEDLPAIAKAVTEVANYRIHKLSSL
jgi:very-short-patch-repair endonuclease